MRSSGSCMPALHSDILLGEVVVLTDCIIYLPPDLVGLISAGKGYNSV